MTEEAKQPEPVKAEPKLELPKLAPGKVVKLKESTKEAVREAAWLMDAPTLQPLSAAAEELIAQKLLTIGKTPLDPPKRKVLGSVNMAEVIKWLANHAPEDSKFAQSVALVLKLRGLLKG